MRTTMDRRHPRAAVLVGLAALALAGCADDDAEDVVFQLPEASPQVVAAIDDEVELDGPAPGDDEDGAAAVGSDTDPAPVAVEEGPARMSADVAGIELLTPAAGDGRWPELAWEAVAGAERYSVTVFLGPGEPAYWAWRGSETSVVVGGGATRTGGGPQVQPGMTWSVVALAADGSVVAQSGERPLGP